MGKRPHGAQSDGSVSTPHKAAVNASRHTPEKTMSTDKPRNANMVDMLTALVQSKGLSAELTAATKYCQGFLSTEMRWQAKGGRVALSTPTAVLERLKNTSGAFFGGALAMMDLDTRVKPMESLDTGRMRWGLGILQSGVKDAIHQVLGEVAVQAESIKDKDEDFSGLRRIERDTDVDCVLLAIYWSKDHPDMLQGLVSQCQDIVYVAQKVGQGLAQHIERFVRMEDEEKQRAVRGQSSWRKAVALKSIIELAGSQRNGRSDAALAAALLSERDSALGEKWGEDTCRRYLLVASKMDTTAQDIMVKWEFVFQRNTLLDSFTNMRAAATACHTSAQMVVLLETLFFEQACGIRKSVVAKSRGHSGDIVNMFRGILLRSTFYNYCRQIFPKLQDSIENFGTWAWYNAEYGMSETGLFEDIAGSDDDDDQDQDGQHEGDMRSRYMSKEKLHSLLSAVAKNKHESAFTSLAKATPVSGTQGNQDLNMSFESMRAVREKVEAVWRMYYQEFPQESAPQQGNDLPDATVQVPQDQAGVYAPASVRTSNNIQTNEEYTARLSQHLADCKRSELDAINDYVGQRVVIKVSEHDTDQIVSKLKSVRLLKESGRKVFILDTLTRDPLNWCNVKRAKRSFLTGAKVQMMFSQPGCDGGDTLAVVKNLYNQFCTQRGTDQLSEDIIVVLVPGNTTDSPENPTLATCWKSLKAVGHKFIGPKIGNVRMQPGELLQQIYTRGCWNRFPENHMVFTFQANPQAPQSAVRKKMKYLHDGGAPADTYFNVWPVPVLPLARMPKTPMSEHESIFADDTAQDSGAEDGAGGAAVDDLGENLIPFPREHHAKLTQEMIHVWDIDVGVVLMPGSGQSLLAFIMENKRAVGIAKNQAHKKFLLKNLTEAVKSLGLAHHNPPPRPPELAVWENSQARAGQTIHPPAPQLQAPSLAAPLSGSAPPPVAGFGAPKETAPSVSAFGFDALPAATSTTPPAGSDAPMTAKRLQAAMPKATPVTANLESFGNTPLR